MQVDFQFGGQDVDDYSFIWRDNQQSSWFVTRVIRVLERCQKVPMDVQIYPFIRVYCCFHSVHAPNHVSETKSVINLGCKHPKETGLGCFGVLEIWRNLRKTVVPFPLRHVTWQSEWRTEWGKASQHAEKFVFSFQLVFPIMHSICIGLLQTFLIMAGIHAEIWNAKKIIGNFHPSSW